MGVKPVIYFHVQTQLWEITLFPKQLLFGALILCCRKWVGSNRRMRSWSASGTGMQSQKTWSALSYVTPKIKNVNGSRERWSQCLWKGLLTFKAFWVFKQTKNSPLRDRKCTHVVSVWNPNLAFFLLYLLRAAGALGKLTLTLKEEAAASGRTANRRVRSSRCVCVNRENKTQCYWQFYNTLSSMQTLPWHPNTHIIIHMHAPSLARTG